MTKSRGAGTSGLRGKARRTAAQRQGGTKNATCIARNMEQASVSISHGTQHGAAAVPGGRQHPDRFGWQAGGAAPACTECAFFLKAGQCVVQLKSTMGQVCLVLHLDTSLVAACEE